MTHVLPVLEQCCITAAAECLYCVLPDQVERHAASAAAAVSGRDVMTTTRDIIAAHGDCVTSAAPDAKLISATQRLNNEPRQRASTTRGQRVHSLVHTPESRELQRNSAVPGRPAHQHTGRVYSLSVRQEDIGCTT